MAITEKDHDRNAAGGRILSPLLHVVFFLSGIGTVLIGQVLPYFERAFSLSDGQLALFFPAQFAGSVAGTLISGIFGRRSKLKQATVIGAAGMAAGILMMNSGELSLVLLGFCLNGIGIGLTLPAINLLVLEMNLHRTASALSLLNFYWGAGAIVAKPFVDLTSDAASGLLFTTLLLAIPLAAGAVLLSLIPISSKERPEPEPAVSGGNGLWAMPLAWAIAAFHFVHVGFESGMGGWITTYSERVAGAPVTNLLSPTFLYFLFFVLGRALGPILFRYFNENRAIVLGLVLVLVGLVIALSASNIGQLSLGSIITGIGTSWIFPTNVSRFYNSFGPEAARKATPLFICGTIGATAVTWGIGAVSSVTGDLSYGMLVLVAAVVLLFGLQAVIVTIAGRRKQA